MALPADFPQPPADRESLAAAVAWIFQVLSWLIARAAAGDKWWIGLEESQPTGVAELCTISSGRTGPSAHGGADGSQETAEAATRSEPGARPIRRRPARGDGSVRGAPAPQACLKRGSRNPKSASISLDGLRTNDPA